MKRWQIIVLILLAIAFVAGAGYLGFSFAQPQRGVTAAATPVTVAVTQGDVKQTVTAPGDLLWTDVINLYMDAEGQIAEINVRSGDWVKAVAPVVGGGGGGKPTLAQAGGKQPDKLPEALETAAQWAKDKLG